MERDTNQMSQSSALCRSGCGFYGSPATDGLCSKCYKDALKRKQSTPPSSVTGPSSSTACGNGTENAPSPVTHPATDVLNTASPTVPAAVPSTSQDSDNQTASSQDVNTEVDTSTLSDSVGSDLINQDDPEQKDLKKKKNRCNICRKKVGLTGFECRCGGLFCSLHRYSNEHNCTFDYKEMGAQEIRKNNPLVVGEKIQKI